MAKISGTSTSEYARLGDLLSETLDSGKDVGASVSVTVEGETVVDIWGGWADEAQTTPWGRDTITNVWSTTKTMTFLSTLVLAERGLLDYHEKVSTYWPEFAQNGKADIEVRHLMGHTSGVSAWEQPVAVEDIYDWEKSTAMLAAQAPWWTPGEGSGYHALNQGHLLGEVIRRIDGRMLGQFFAEEIAGPLDADFHIGLDPSEFDRVSNVIPPPALAIDMATMDPDSVLIKTFTGPAPDATESWTPEWRQATIGAANGHGNARSVARIQAIVANGGTVDGVELLSPDTIKMIFEEQANGVDQVLGLPVRFGMGYALHSIAVPYLPEGNYAYWGGWGGSSIIVDIDRKITFAYVMNRMDEGLLGDTRGIDLATEVFKH
ncbi:MAG: beta-lactamase family protein [Ilumatobacter sp.]|jgi:CubicO group peptidase (beta-lactamase class C family)|uniref:serine hydrolase domain-containing protein n=1 Tax=Ilumatobacter sp. TaxID=1967498 RepID=UPI00374FAE9C|nr:beta-lactamase family protein [Ilumatobacter sp.]MBT5865156.1 beta-lactamase family protein [Ilumatobacter sp.]MBT7428735.1 beta-lactamase family protein [Ilumatobacter sp.]